MAVWLITEIWAKGYDGLTVYPNPETGEVVHIPPAKEPTATKAIINQLTNRIEQVQADITAQQQERTSTPNTLRASSRPSPPQDNG